MKTYRAGTRYVLSSPFKFQKWYFSELIAFHRTNFPIYKNHAFCK
nr:MAG TPA: hypothetical protein [Caudoviricetes sp.]